MSNYSETSLIRLSMGPENNVGLGGCWITECLLPYLSMVTVPHIMVGLERMLDYRGVGLERFHCTTIPVVGSAGGYPRPDYPGSTVTFGLVVLIGYCCGTFIFPFLY